jgi:hypothetical protein
MAINTIKLRKSSREKMLFGVAGGLAEDLSLAGQEWWGQVRNAMATTALRRRGMASAIIALGVVILLKWAFSGGLTRPTFGRRSLSSSAWR